MHADGVLHGTPVISGERVKLETSNLARRLTAGVISEVDKIIGKKLAWLRPNWAWCCSVKKAHFSRHWCIRHSPHMHTQTDQEALTGSDATSQPLWNYLTWIIITMYRRIVVTARD